MSQRIVIVTASPLAGNPRVVKQAGVLADADLGFVALDVLEEIDDVMRRRRFALALFRVARQEFDARVQAVRLRLPDHVALCEFFNDLPTCTRVAWQRLSSRLGHPGRVEAEALGSDGEPARCLGGTLSWRSLNDRQQS